MNKKTIRIMLVEDHIGYRETIAIALEQNENMELGSQFGTAEIASANCRMRRPKPTGCHFARSKPAWYVGDRSAALD